MSRAPHVVEPVKMPPYHFQKPEMGGGCVGQQPPAKPDFAVTDHAAAAAEILERYAKRLRSGDNVEDVARELLPIVRVMARRT